MQRQKLSPRLLYQQLDVMIVTWQNFSFDRVQGQDIQVHVWKWAHGNIFRIRPGSLNNDEHSCISQ